MRAATRPLPRCFDSGGLSPTSFSSWGPLLPKAHHISPLPLLQREGSKGLRWSFQGLIGPAPIPSALVDTWGQRELSPRGVTAGGLVCP